MSDEVVVARKSPYKADLKAGQKHFWCSCGRSRKQPFCDGSHKGTTFAPVIFTPDADGDAWLCGCKHTANRPFCDGSHSSLPE